MHNLTPPSILEERARGTGSGTFDAVVLFVDTSGFTPLTMRLTEQGRDGAEVLADILQAVFEPLVDAVYVHGGYIAGFAGDAFKAIFPGLGKESYRHALTAAAQIRAYIRQHPTHATRHGAFDFTVRVSIADGAVTWAIWASDTEGARQSSGYTFSGAAIDAAIMGEDFADGGELVVTRAVYDAVRAGNWGRIRSTALRDAAAGYVRIDEILPISSMEAEKSLFRTRARGGDDIAADSALAAQFYPESLLNTTIRGEFRVVYSVFVNVQHLPDPGADDDFLPRFFQLLHGYGGYLCRIGRIGANDPGGTFLLFWGAPISHENDLMRALSFLLALRSQLDAPFRAGVTHGMSYAGFIGSSLREEYTCYGRSVNQAARQMGAAEWGQILLDEGTARRAEYDFAIALAGHFALKGLPGAQPLFALHDEQIQRPSTPIDAAFVGRARELEQLQAAIRPIFSGHFGGLTLISGEAGIGKSRLVHHALAALSEKQIQLFLCQTDEILRGSLNPFRYFLRHYFDQASAADEATNIANFHARLDALIARTAHDALREELMRTRSFLGALINLSWDDSLYARLEPQLRFENTLAALKALLLAESQHRPTVILLEDVHWLDADSLTFLSQLTRNVDDVAFAMLATTRPTEQASTFPPEMVTNEIAIVPLSASDVMALTRHHLGGDAAPALCELLFARAGGNPFFVEQMLLYAQEEEMLVEGEAGWQMADAAADLGDGAETRLPTDLESMLIARLDRLSQAVKEVVQTAAVLGREFSVRVLSNMLRGDAAVNDKVQSAQESAVWDALDELRYLFRHALLRDAAYEMQLRTRLRGLHQVAAEAIETLNAENLPLYYADLVYHYHEAGGEEKERHYARLAGERAAARYENYDAVAYLSRALALTLPAAYAQQFELRVQRVKVFNVLAEREQEAQELDALMQLANELDDDLRRVDAALLRVDYHVTVGQYDAGERAMQEAIPHAQHHRGRLVDVHLQWSNALIFQSKFDAAQEHLAQAEPLVAGSGLRREADFHYYWGFAAVQKSENVLAQLHLEQALAIYRQLGDPIQEGQVLNLLGCSLRSQGESILGMDTIRSAQEIWRTAGFRRGEMMADGNLGHGYLDEGNYLAAQRHYKRAMQRAIDARDPFTHAVTLQNVALTMVELGDFANAIPLYQEAIALYRSISVMSHVYHTMSNLALLFVNTGDFDRAVALASESVDGLQAMNTDALAGLPHYIRGRALVGLGRFDEAQAAYDQASALLQDKPQNLVEVSAACIELAVARGEPQSIRELLEEVIAFLMDDPIGVGHLTYVYAAVYHALNAFDDDRAAAILRKACAFMGTRAELIDDERLKQTYREHVPAHRKLLREGARILGNDECP